MFSLLNSRSVHVTLIATIVLQALYVGLCSASIHADIENHRLLGGSADISSRSLGGLMQLYPELPPKATIYIEDSEEPLAWDEDSHIGWDS